MRSAAFSIIVALLVILSLLLTRTVAAGEYVGKVFPRFEAKDAVTGEPIDLRAFRGKVVLIDFWATWCGPCVAELPNVRSVHRKYKDRGFEIISISLDTDRRRFDAFIDKNGMPWHHVMEGGGWKTRLARKYGIRSIPAMFVLDHEGRCVSDSARGRKLGPVVERALRALPAALPDGGAAASGGGPGAASWHARVEAVGDDLQYTEHQRILLTEKLDGVDRAIRALESSRRAGRDAVSFPDRYRQLHGDLEAIRAELFVRGFIDDRVIALPADPFAAGDADPRLTRDRAGRSLPTLARASADMRAAVNEAMRPLLAIRSDLEVVARRLRRGGDDAARNELARLREATDELRARSHDAWVRQLERIEEVMARLAGVEPGAHATLESLSGRIDRCRADLPASGHDPEAGRRVREEFAAMCRKIRDLGDRLVERGVLAPGSVEMPSDPCTLGSLTDARVRVEAERQLERAVAAVERIRAAVDEAGRTLAKEVAPAQELREALTEAGDDRAGREEVRRRFTEMIRAILARWDGVRHAVTPSTS